MLTLFLIPWRGHPKRHGGPPLSLVPNGLSPLGHLLRDYSQRRMDHAYTASIDDDCLRLATLTAPMGDIIRQTLGVNATSFIVRAMSYDALMDRAPAVARMDITLRTPTCFFRAEGEGHDLLPAPATLFGALSRRWGVVGAPPLPTLDFASVTTIGCAITSERITGRGGSFGYGVTGRISYLVPEQDACLFWALAFFGEFAGVGRRTAYGWGRMDVRTPTGIHPIGDRKGVQ